MLQPEKKELKWNDNKTTKQGGKRKKKRGTHETLRVLYKYICSRTFFLFYIGALE
jgi:hypothetical protein